MQALSEAPLTVVSVTRIGGFQATWLFSGPATATGFITNAHLLNNAADAPIASQASANAVNVIYPNPVTIGNPWSIAATPANIAEAALITVPQSGLIV